MKLVSEFKNDMMKRREVVFLAGHVGNPGFGEVKKKVAEHFKTTEECIAVKEVVGKFGTDQYTTRVFVYSSAKDLEHCEPKPRVKAKKEGAA